MSIIKNIILISIDDLRFDCIGCEEDKRLLREYGVEKLVNTPNIDKLAKNGVRFSRCISTSSYTPPSHASMLTGLYPNKHGIVTFFGKLPKDIYTLAEILNREGYKTFARIEHLVLKLQDITRGISVIDDPQNDENEVFSYFSKRTNHKDEKIFLFIHLFDVHKPYYYATGGEERKQYNKDYFDIIREISERRDIDFDSLLEKAEKEARMVVKNYDELSSSLREYANMRSLDYLLREHLRDKGTLFDEIIPLYVKGVNKFDRGKFHDLIHKLDEFKLLEDSLLIITSDHGETRCVWNGREDFMNSFNLQEGAIRVPLILYSENLPKGEVIDSPVSLIDIVPTVLDMIDSNFSSSEFDGESLLPLIEDGEEWKDRYILSETWAYRGGINQFGIIDYNHESFRRQIAVIKDGYKYIKTGAEISEEDMEIKEDSEFVKTLFRKILGEFENETELRDWTSRLKNKEIDRNKLKEIFLGKINKLNLRKMLFNVDKDIEEKNNLFGSSRYQDIIKELNDKVCEYEERGITQEGPNKEDMEKVKERLRLLGYLD